MNAQDAKNYLEEQLPDMTVEVDENYSNQNARNATRFIFTKGEQKTNLMFKQNFKIDTEVLDGVVTAIKKKFATAEKATVSSNVVQAVPELAPQVESESVNREEYKVLLELFSNARSFEDARRTARQKLRELESESPMT